VAALNDGMVAGPVSLPVLYVSYMNELATAALFASTVMRAAAPSGKQTGRSDQDERRRGENRSQDRNNGATRIELRMGFDHDRLQSEAEFMTDGSNYSNRARNC
jgi:hypothetical protein